MQQYSQTNYTSVIALGLKIDQWEVDTFVCLWNWSFLVKTSIHTCIQLHDWTYTSFYGDYCCSLSGMFLSKNTILASVTHSITLSTCRCTARQESLCCSSKWQEHSHPRQTIAPQAYTCWSSHTVQAELWWWGSNWFCRHWLYPLWRAGGTTQRGSGRVPGAGCCRFAGQWPAPLPGPAVAPRPLHSSSMNSLSPIMWSLTDHR